MTNEELNVRFMLVDAKIMGFTLSGKQLAYAVGLENTAQLRKIIHSLRIQGEHICSSNAGYWYARNEKELLQSSMQMERLAFSILRAARGMRGHLVGQIELVE